MNILGIVFLMIHVVVGDHDKNDESINIADESVYSNFSYTKDTIFRTTIYLTNLPTDVTYYTLYYGTDNLIQEEVVPPGVKDMTIYVKKALTVHKEVIEIKIKLFKNDMLCAHKVIGRASVISTYRSCYWPCTRCSPYSNDCNWAVDFQNMCVVITKTGSVVNFYSDAKSQNVNPNDYILHQWLQIYTDNDLFVGASPQTVSRKNKYTMIAESFDDNTYVDCRSSSLRANQITSDSMTKLHVIDNDNKTDNQKDVRILKYSASKEYKFHCQKYLKSTYFIQMGMINTTANKIKIYDRGNFIMNFKMADNGSIICCLLYNIQEDKDNVTHITRRIKNRKLLVYDEFADDDGNRVIIYIISGVLGGACLLLGILFIIYKKCCFKGKPEMSEVMEETEETDGANLENEVELETYYSSPNPIFYADLDMSVAARPTRSAEESHYVNIIGVVSPFNRNNKNDRKK